MSLDAEGRRTASNNSWSSSTLGFDTEGRLTSASYPDGSTEADQSDADSNRTVITGITLAGTPTPTLLVGTNTEADAV